MNITEYSWSFAVTNPYKINHNLVPRNLHAEFKRTLNKIQSSELFEECNLAIISYGIYYNNVCQFSLQIEKDKFSLCAWSSIKEPNTVILQGACKSICSSESIIAALALLKSVVKDEVIKNNCAELTRALEVAI